MAETPSIPYTNSQNAGADAMDITIADAFLPTYPLPQACLGISDAPGFSNDYIANTGPPIQQESRLDGPADGLFVETTTPVPLFVETTTPVPGTVEVPGDADVSIATSSSEESSTSDYHTDSSATPSQSSYSFAHSMRRRRLINALKIKRKFMPTKCVYFFFYGARAIQFANFMVFLEWAGLKPDQAGLIQGVMMAIVTVTASIWGILADRTGKYMLLLCVQNVLSSLFVLAMPLSIFLIDQPPKAGQKLINPFLNTNASNIIEDSIMLSSQPSSSDPAQQFAEDSNSTLFAVMLCLSIGHAVFGGGISIIIDSLVLTLTKRASKGTGTFGRQRLFGSFAFAIFPVAAGMLTESVNMVSNLFLPSFLLIIALSICLLVSSIYLVAIYNQLIPPCHHTTIEEVVPGTQSHAIVDPLTDDILSKNIKTPMADLQQSLTSCNVSSLIETQYVDTLDKQKSSLLIKKMFPTDIGVSQQTLTLQRKPSYCSNHIIKQLSTSQKCTSDATLVGLTNLMPNTNFTSDVNESQQNQSPSTQQCVSEFIQRSRQNSEMNLDNVSLATTLRSRTVSVFTSLMMPAVPEVAPVVMPIPVPQTSQEVPYQSFDHALSEGGESFSLEINRAPLGAEAKTSAEKPSTFCNNLMRGPVLCFLASIVQMGICGGTQWACLYLMMNEMGASKTLMGLTILFQCICETITIPAWYTISNKLHNNEVAMLIGIMGYAAGFYLCYFIQQPEYIIGVCSCFGVSYGIFYSASMEELYRVTDPHHVTSMLGMYTAVYSGLGFAISSVACGSLYTQFGPKLTLVIIAGTLTVLCGAMALRIICEAVFVRNHQQETSVVLSNIGQDLQFSISKLTASKVEKMQESVEVQEDFINVDIEDNRSEVDDHQTEQVVHHSLLSMDMMSPEFATSALQERPSENYSVADTNSLHLNEEFTDNVTVENTVEESESSGENGQQENWWPLLDIIQEELLTCKVDVDSADKDIQKGLAASCVDTCYEPPTSTHDKIQGPILDYWEPVGSEQISAASEETSTPLEFQAVAFASNCHETEAPDATGNSTGVAVFSGEAAIQELPRRLM